MAGPGRVLVTGSSGRLGRFVVEALREAGWLTTGIDLTQPTDRAADRVVIDDAGDPYVLGAALKGHDALVHLAAIPDPTRDTAFVTFEANLQLANAAVAATQQNGVRNIVFASSQSALGFAWAPVVRSPAYLPVDEDHPCAPEEIYGVSKQATESLFEMATRRDGADAVALRFPVIWDPSEFADSTQRRLGNPQQGAKSQWAYIDARDAGRSVVLALAAPVRGFRVFNIAADDVFAEEDAMTLARHWYPDRDAAQVEGRSALFSPARAKAELGFVNRYRWTPSGIQDRGA